MKTSVSFPKERNKILHITYFILLIVPSVSAQNCVTSAGGNASGAGGQISYAVGQVMHSPYSGSGGAVNQGVQQTYEISVITSNIGTEKTQLELAVYPNPVGNNLTLRITGDVPLQCFVYLYDINGSLLMTKKIDGYETSVSMEACLPGTYFLKVIQGRKEVKTFKIIKK